MQVTVVTPVWDRCCAFLGGCVENVLAQVPCPSMVVVDNASQVPLPDLPQHVTVCSTPKRVSVGNARNIGLEAVVTPYVCFADADDRILPGTLDFCATRLDACPELVACATSVLEWSPDDGRLRPAKRPRRHAYAFSHHRRLFALYQLAFLSALSTTSGTVFRTDAVREAGGFGDADVGEDSMLALPLAWHGAIELHRRPGRVYRVEQGSLIHRRVSRYERMRSVRGARMALRADAAVPRSVKASLPIVAVLHRIKVEAMLRMAG